MTYKVQFFDTNGKLICWYSTPKRQEAYKYADNIPCNGKVEVTEHYA